MRNLTLLVVATIVIACTNVKKENKTIYTSTNFQINSNKVVQGDNVAEILSPTHITSTYQTTASQTYSNKIEFKFCINEKDCELPANTNHTIYIGDENETPVILFGNQFISRNNAKNIYLSPNYKYTFKVDVSAINEDFDKNKSFKCADGSLISKNDFNGFYISGSSAPLTWDFSNLDERGLKLQPTSDRNIYTITLILNPLDTTISRQKEWILTKDISQKPQFSSNLPIVDALYNMSIEEALMNIEPDSTFRTGAKWGGVWTRDVSYSIYLAFAYHQPDVAIISLKKKVKRGRIIQDTGSGGAWPVSSDRVVWALAANEIYKYTGDKEWLGYAFEVIKNSVEDDRFVLLNPKTGLYKGESSFLDWREQTYPKWMQNADIYNSENLGTNVAHAQALQICGDMAEELGYDGAIYHQQSEELKKSINEHLWLTNRGFYAQYLYGRENLKTSTRFEALGEALAVITKVASKQQAEEIYSKSPLTEFGTTCIYPQIPGIPPYHNNAVWPFVQAYWNLGAAQAKNEDALTHGLASIYRAGALFLTNYENFVATNGDYYGTEINSHRMLWSMAGNIAMVHRVFMGISFEKDKIHFNPVVPEAFNGEKHLTNFKYREATLDITVKGFGANIASFKIDGEEQQTSNFLAATAGNHKIEIDLDNKSFNSNGVNRVNNHYSLQAPVTEFRDRNLVWSKDKNASNYHIYVNDSLLKTTSDTTLALVKYGEYRVEAIDSQNWSSFSSEPFNFINNEYKIVLGYDTKPSTEFEKGISNFKGDGFIEINSSKNLEISNQISSKKAGVYNLKVRYANGSGAWNTDNSCALRSLFVNDKFAGTIVLPQRGTGEWSNWGYSNSVSVQLNKGDNIIKLSFMPWNHNMNFETNRALLDEVIITAAD